MKMNTQLAAFAAFFLAAGPVAAATFTFDSNSLDSNDQMTVDGITVTAYAGNYLDWPNPDTIISTDSYTVTQSSNGLGVRTNFLDDDDVDGFIAANEVLTLTFSERVDFSQVLFANWDDNDSFDLFVDYVLVDPEERSGYNPYPLAGLFGTSISFGADALDDDFKIKSITVAPVPLPAGGLLLLAGLGGFTTLRRRKG